MEWVNLTQMTIISTKAGRNPSEEMEYSSWPTRVHFSFAVMFDTLVFICTFSLTCPMTFLKSDLLILSLLICERVTVTLLWSCSWDSGPLSEVMHALCQWGGLMQPQPSHPGMARPWCGLSRRWPKAAWLCLPHRGSAR